MIRFHWQRDPTPRWRRGRSLAGYALVGSAVVILVAVRYESSARALLQAQTQLTAAQVELTALRQHPDQAGLRRVEDQLRMAERNLTTGSHLVGDGLEVRLLGHLPLLGGQIRGVQAMRTTAAAAVQVGRLALPMVGAILPDPGAAKQSRDHVELLVAAMTPTRLAAERVALGQLQVALADADAHRLWWPLAEVQAHAVRQGRAVLTGATQAVEIGGVLHTALGPGKHRYLILLGNPAEERPGGGFIGVIGLLESTEGHITSTNFQDSYFRPSRVLDRRAPRPLDQHLFLGRPMQFPDSNWSADFPTSAAEVASFYRAETGQPIDGVLAISTTTIGSLLRVVGTVPVPGYPQLVTPDNVLRELSSIANRIRPGDPGKEYVVDFGHALLDRIRHASSTQLPGLGKVFGQATRTRDLVVWLRSPDLQRVLTEHDASGELTVRPHTDQLMVTDANISGGKNDLFVRRSAAVDVTVASDGSAQHHLALSYLQPKPANQLDALLQPGGGGAYRNYIEVRVPAGATLTGMQIKTPTGTQPSGPEAIDTDHGFARFSFFLVLLPGQSATVSFDYRTTAAFDTLVWQKQIQALDHQLRATVHWPDGTVSQATSQAEADMTLRRGQATAH